MTRRLAELTSPEVATTLRATSTIVQPIGAVEQHGPHLPLIADTLVVAAIADAAVAHCGEDLDVWLLEPLAYGKSNEHQWAAGTVVLSTPTLLGVLMDIGRSVAATPARNLVFLNGHGGNTALLSTAARDLRVDAGLATYVVHPFLAYVGTSDTDELDFHAGESETSVVGHLRPELVRWELRDASGQDPLAGNDHLRLDGSIDFGWRSDDFGARSGVIGDPTTASAPLGAALFERMVAYTVEALTECCAHRLPPTD